MKKKISKVLTGIIIMAMLLLSGCGRESFWEKMNEVRIIQKFDIIVNDELASTVLNQETKDLEVAHDIIVQKVERLKKGIMNFFEERYDVDTSAKLEKLDQIMIYSADEYKGNILNGYAENNTIYLNKNILGNEDIFNCVVIHETIHTLGFVGDDDNSDMYIIEGFTEALTIECLEYMKKTGESSSVYRTFAQLASQILVVDKDIVKETLEQGRCNIKNKINNSLKDCKVLYLNDENVNFAETMECCFSTIVLGYATYETLPFLEFQAQEIVACYCKTFQPSKSEIKKIRRNYIIEDFEDVLIEQEGENITLYMR